jgi:tetratricopeptide (TPR) repeat protein
VAKARAAVFVSALLLGSGGGGFAAESPSVPLFEGLGGLSRKVTTASPEAQRYFDQGLAFLYAFNHDESIRAFRRAGELDPKCAMAFWGVSVANGPHINNPVVPEDRAKAAWEALKRAQAAAAGARPVEQALIEALASRYALPQPEDRKPLEQAYADAMRKVWRVYPKDADVGALFAESLADLRPWDLWMPDGKPQPGTEELVVTLESVLALDPRHPLANHLMIHAVEASPHPEKADRAADTLRDLQPGLGHMVHMPSHVDVRRGRWQQAIDANAKAMDADRRYTARSPHQGFYRLYMAHNHHMLTYGAMMTGQSALALKTIRAMVADIPLEFFKANPFADGFMAMPLEVMMRFGRWDEILAEPAFPDFVPISRALQHYARAVAHAAKDDVPSALKEQAAFLEARARVPKEAFFGNNTGPDVLDVAESFMRGEILFRSGKTGEGLASLREAAAREDKLRYDEPPDWIQPVRHALGAALLQAGRLVEAEAVFREDLAKLPGNGWGLYGLSRALQLQKKTAEAAAVERQFDDVWKRADLKIKSACLCLPGV